MINYTEESHTCECDHNNSIHRQTLDDKMTCAIPGCDCKKEID